MNTIHKYFSETVRLFKEIDLEKWLKEKNIVPLDDINKVYEFKSFYQAIFEKRPFTFQVKCSPLQSNQTVSILDHINFCLDKNLNRINCPAIPSMQSDCNAKIVFPTLETDITLEKRKRSIYKKFVTNDQTKVVRMKDQLHLAKYYKKENSN